MKLGVYAIWDRKAEVYSMPFFQQKDVFAQRIFQNMQQEGSETTVSKYPTDYELHKLGDYDDESGKIDCYESNKWIENGRAPMESSAVQDEVHAKPEG